ncbi:hypothetical protein DL770_008641 [Monosporascus sp. CRB-9-2]|nr:hypothetical protein DL770_008641 [Monosporascus sp. CRB-9-2]
MTSLKTSTPRLVSLASTITGAVNRIQAILSAKGIPSPSFDEDASTSLPTEVLDAQDAILDATSELQDLLLEPPELLARYGAHNNMVSLQAISRFRIASLVPEGGQISFSEIARQTGLSNSMTCRLLRHAMTMRVFCEPKPGMVAHTKASKALRTPHLNSWLACGSHEMWPAAVKMIDAAMKWPDSQEPNETAFALANDTRKSIYDTIRADPERLMRFAGAMETFSRSPRYDTAYITEHYDWESLGSASVVDVGGGKGHIAMAIARRFPRLRITVQDIAQVVEGAESDLTAGLKGRVSFMPHELFSPQIIQADIYYIRWVLHNWPDRHTIAILRAQIPMLRKGTRVLIHETCMPAPGEIPLWRERSLRAADLNMAAIFNAQERTVEEWKALLTEADSRFKLTKVIQPRGSALAILEVVWEGEG